METKALIDKRQSPHFRGWERVGAELTNNRVDHREQLDVSTEHAPYPAAVEPAYLRLDGPNQWLPEHALPGFHAAVDEFFTRMGALAWELMEGHDDIAIPSLIGPRASAGWSRAVPGSG